MGQDCCTNRFKTQIRQTSRHHIDTASAFIQTTINPFKNSLSVSFLYLLTGNIANQSNKKMILELAEQCSKNHICCYFDPDYLQKHHGLVEYQSPGSLFSRNNLAEAFQAELDYFYEENICNEIFKFKVILLIESEGKSLQSLTIIRWMDPQKGNYFVVYDRLNRSKLYRERIYQDEQSLNSFLNEKGECYFDFYTLMPLSIKLLTFDQIDDKTESDIENIANNHNLIQTTNLINTHPSFHSLQSNQQQVNSKSNASIQQQQQQKLSENQIIPLSVQLQNLPSNERNNRKSNSCISSQDEIRSFQSLNQLTLTSKTKQQRNSSQSAPSEKSETYILRQPQNKQRQILTKYQLSDQLPNKKFLSKIKQINQNWLEIKKDNYLQQQFSQLKQKNYKNLQVSPQIQLIQNKGDDINFFSNNFNSNILLSDNMLHKKICIERDNDNQFLINAQNQNKRSQDNQNGQDQEMADDCSNSYFSCAENYNQNHQNGKNIVEDFEILDKNKSPATAFNQLNYQREEEDEHHSFDFCGQIAENHCDNESNDFLSDDASQIQICIQSENILEQEPKDLTDKDI